MKKSIGTYLEEQVESGAISENQATYYYDRNHNIQWVGRAAYCPVYLDHCELKKAEIVGNELRVYEGRPEELTENKAEYAAAEETKEDTMKFVSDEITYFMVRKAEEKAVINNVKAYGIHSAIIFSVYTPDEAAKEFGITEPHYFVTRISTYGKAYCGIRNTKNKASFEVSKEFGRRIYKEVCTTKRFDYESCD